MKRNLLLYLCLLLLTQCTNCKGTDPTPEEQLPPATQTGANTFGCLLNGQPWTPKGNGGFSNFSVTYDPTYKGGNLDIRAYRYLDQSGKFQYITLGGDRISQVGVYPFLLQGDRTIYFTDTSKNSPCNDYSAPPTLTYRTGSLTVTRLDMRAGIISGTFEFTLAKPGCDTIKVTQGRFDKKL